MRSPFSLPQHLSLLVLSKTVTGCGGRSCVGIYFVTHKQVGCRQGRVAR